MNRQQRREAERAKRRVKATAFPLASIEGQTPLQRRLDIEPYTEADIEDPVEREWANTYYPMSVQLSDIEMLWNEIHTDLRELAEVLDTDTEGARQALIALKGTNNEDGSPIRLISPDPEGQIGDNDRIIVKYPDAR